MNYAKSYLTITFMNNLTIMDDNDFKVRITNPIHLSTTNEITIAKSICSRNIEDKFGLNLWYLILFDHNIITV